MREPQATSALAPRPARCARIVAALVLLVTVTGVGDAQIRGGPIRQPSEGYWFSGGASAASIGDINDGKTGSTWKFSTDPLWQLRGTLEKALDEATTIGVAVAYGKVDLRVTPFAATAVPQGEARATPLPAECSTGCDAQTELWSLMGQFRSGGGPGFHTFFEATGGVTNFRNLRTRTDGSANGIAIGKPAGSLDLTGAIGGGFGYTLSNGFVVAVVQDFGIGFHSKDDLPSGLGRTWRTRNTRASLRFHF